MRTEGRHCPSAGNACGATPSLSTSSTTPRLARRRGSAPRTSRRGSRMRLRLCRRESVPRESAAAAAALRVVTASRPVAPQARPRTMVARPAPGDLDPPTRPRPPREWTTDVHLATVATEGGRRGLLLTIDVTPATLAMHVTAGPLASPVDDETGTGATSGTASVSASNDGMSPGATSVLPRRHRLRTRFLRNRSSRLLHLRQTRRLRHSRRACA